MLTLTTYELRVLVVAAPGHDSWIPAVADHRARPMCPLAPASFRTDDFRTEPAVFGTWNRPRRLVGFVT